MSPVPVLIAGTGPTGMALALSLARRGVKPRIVDPQPGPATHSRAMAVHARTLEFYRQFGFADEVVAAGVPVRAAHLRRQGRDGAPFEAARLEFTGMGEGLSPYPFVLAYPQDDHERLLTRRLAEQGVSVDWGVALKDFSQDGAGVRATLEGPRGTETVEALYLAGCDGGHSQVRQGLGVGFSGGAYEQRFFVADVKIAGGFERDLYFNLGAHTLVLMLPVRSSGMQRLIGLVPPALADQRELDFEHLRGEIEPLAGIKVEAVNWFSTYRVHHRVADRFQVGRAFLAGDAGHVHSPAGGQGMNTGIGDAMNLGWKLADVVRGRAAPALLDSYEPERIAFARALVSTTDRAFRTMIDKGFAGEVVRNLLAPALAGLVSHLPPARQSVFRLISQIEIRYPDSPLSRGEAGVHGGDRLPWVGEIDNFAPLASLDWQVHAYGGPPQGLAAACARHGLALHLFDGGEAADRAGLRGGAAYLVRPDGYVGLAAGANFGAELDAYVQAHGLQLD